MLQSDSIRAKQPDVEWQRYHLSLKDGGPVYAETNPDRFIVEPWNAVSSLLLLLPAVYWAVRLRNRYRHYPFITYCIPLLLLGGLGSTLFHAFRTSSVFLYLDVMPTALLTVSLGVYFWLKASGRWWIGASVIAASVGFRLWVFGYFSPHTAVNISYAITGTVMFIPLLYMVFKTHFHKISDILLTVAFLGMALFFREADAWRGQYLPMGTHFLWHAFSAVGAFFLARYLYFLESRQLHQRQNYSK